jgi:hypothetical protein
VSEELVKRLRKWAKSDLGLIVMYEAADTIEAQAAEIKRLRGIVVNYVDPFDVTPDDEVFVEAVQRAALGVSTNV